MTSPGTNDTDIRSFVSFHSIPFVFLFHPTDTTYELLFLLHVLLGGAAFPCRVAPPLGGFLAPVATADVL